MKIVRLVKSIITVLILTLVVNSSFTPISASHYELKSIAPNVMSLTISENETLIQIKEANGNFAVIKEIKTENSIDMYIYDNLTIKELLINKHISHSQHYSKQGNIIVTTDNRGTKRTYNVDISVKSVNQLTESSINEIAAISYPTPWGASGTWDGVLNYPFGTASSIASFIMLFFSVPVSWSVCIFLGEWAVDKMITKMYYTQTNYSRWLDSNNWQEYDIIYFYDRVGTSNWINKETTPIVTHYVM